MNERKTLSQVTLEALLAEVVEHTMDGWAISDDEPGTVGLFAGSFAVTMVRSDATVNTFKQRSESVQARPKLTPQERMAHARAQRGKGALKLGEVVNP